MFLVCLLLNVTVLVSSFLNEVTGPDDPKIIPALNISDFRSSFILSIQETLATLVIPSPGLGMKGQMISWGFYWSNDQFPLIILLWLIPKFHGIPSRPNYSN